MSRVVLLATLAAIAIAAPTAAAKSVDSVAFCGADGCRQFGHRTAQKLLEMGALSGVPISGGVGRAAFFRMKIRYAAGPDPFTQTILFAPAAGAVSDVEGGWQQLQAYQAEFLRSMISGRPPLPGTRMPAAQVEAPRLPAPAVTPATVTPPPAPDGGGTPWWLLAGIPLLAGLSVLLTRAAAARRGTRFGQAQTRP